MDNMDNMLEIDDIPAISKINPDEISNENYFSMVCEILKSGFISTLETNLIYP